MFTVLHPPPPLLPCVQSLLPVYQFSRSMQTPGSQTLSPVLHSPFLSRIQYQLLATSF